MDVYSKAYRASNTTDRYTLIYSFSGTERRSIVAAHPSSQTIYTSSANVRVALKVRPLTDAICAVLTPYLPREKVRKAKNLLSQGASIGDEEEEEEADVLMPHWHSVRTYALRSKLYLTIHVEHHPCSCLRRKSCSVRLATTAHPRT